MCNQNKGLTIQTGIIPIGEYRVRQRGCSLTHSARTPPAVHPGIMNWVDKIEINKKKKIKKIGGGRQIFKSIFGF